MRNPRGKYLAPALPSNKSNVGRTHALWIGNVKNNTMKAKNTKTNTSSTTTILEECLEYTPM